MGRSILTIGFTMILLGRGPPGDRRGTRVCTQKSEISPDVAYTGGSPRAPGRDTIRRHEWVIHKPSAAYQAVPEALLIVGLDGSIVFAKPIRECLFGYEPGQLVDEVEDLVARASADSQPMWCMGRGDIPHFVLEGGAKSRAASGLRRLQAAVGDRRNTQPAGGYGAAREWRS
jgi:hypothetical protein